MAKTPEQKAAKKAREAAQRAAKWQRATTVPTGAPAIEFAPAENWATIIRDGAREDRRRAMINIGQE